MTNLVDEPHVGFIVASLRDVHDQVEVEEAVHVRGRRARRGRPGDRRHRHGRAGDVLERRGADLYGWTARQVVGRPIPVTLTSTPFFDDAGVRVGTIGVSSDISARLRSVEATATLSKIVESDPRRDLLGRSPTG